MPPSLFGADKAHGPAAVETSTSRSAPRELCLDLIRADSEGDVKRLLVDSGYWDDPAAWQNYGDTENNFATIGNQQSQPEAALVEKLVNSVDAVLLRECHIKNIRPDGPAAPRSIVEAQETFFRILDGKLSNLQAVERRELARKNICLTATGSRRRPCYTIVDTGEGQTPEMLPQTFLSLARSNKLSIPFVQGKFNMGGTGALQFCGTHNLQLIVSRRHPSIRDLRGNQPDRRWGFTVVRRENPTAGRRSSLYTYLAPSGHILSFNAESIPGMPGQYPDAYKAPLEAGSLIKLYEYRMPRAQSALTLRPYYRLSLMLPNVALPIVLCERRAGFTARSLDTTLAGLTTRLDTRDRALEPGFPASLALRVGGQPFGVSVYAFRRGKAESYRAREGVLFTINGQKHAHFDDRFFMRKKVALPFLRESLLVMVDCSNLSGRQREDLFMNSRDRLREGRLKSMLEKELEGALREHPGLKKLNVTRRQEAIGQKIKRSRMLAKTLTDLLSRNPELATLLGSGTRIPNPFPKDQATTAFEGKKFPTFFRLRGRPPRSCQKKKRHAVHFETDASNDYFERDSEQGSFAVTSAGRAVDCRFTLFNGHGILSVPPDPSAVVGDVVSYRVKVTDPSRSPMDPFVEAWEVTVRPATEESRPRPKPRGNLLSLPEVYEVREADWRLHSFDRRSALSVVPRAGKAYTFFINMDNLFLLSEQKASREDVRILGERFKTALVLIGLALLRDSEDREQRDGHDGREEDVFSRIGLVGRALAPVLLPMIGHLGNLDVGE